MKNGPFYILIVAVFIVAFFSGRGCADDTNVEEIVRQNALRIEKLQAARDSLRALRATDAEAIETYYRRITVADSVRRIAEGRALAALALLAKMPTYETLSHDDLARRADSLFIARADE